MSADIIASRAMVWAAKVQSLADQARDLTLDAAQSVGARYADETRAVDIQKLLEGRSDREKIDGMRRVIAISSKGTDMSDHFASVVKNVASSNLELRKLVYIYLARYAESQPDLALLSINTIQKALSDQNQIVRGLALRLISSIRVVSISGIVLLSIKKCIADSSEYVRKTAAMSIPKTNALDRSLHPQLKECLKQVMADENPNVMAAALEACDAICAGENELIHPVYRRVCQSLARMDEFAQVSVLRILERYSRECFTDPGQQTKDDPEEDFYNSTASRSVDQDLALLLKSVVPLLASRNTATVVSACRLLSSLGADSDAQRVVQPMISLLRKSEDLQFLVLTNVVVLALERPNLWSRAAQYFLIHPADQEYIWKLKLEIITLIIDADNADLLVSELAQYSYDVADRKLAKAAVHALCKCAQHSPVVAPRCIQILFDHIRSDDAILIGESVVAIRQLIQLDPPGHISDIKVLARSLDVITAPPARASIFWLVCENLRILRRIAPDVLRIGLQAFSSEVEEVRLQIMTLAVKMYVLHSQHVDQEDVEEVNTAINAVEEAQTISDQANNVMDEKTNGGVQHDIESAALTAQGTLPDVDSPIPKMYAHMCQLARYDSSYDVRDRLRTYKILASSPTWVLTQKLLFYEQTTPTFVSTSAAIRQYSLGSSSMLAGKHIANYQEVPPWSTQIIGASERNVEQKASAVRSVHHKSLPAVVSGTHSSSNPPLQSATKPKSKLTGISSLDDFYATSSEEDSASDSEEDDSSEEYESSGTEEDEEETSAEEDNSESESENSAAETKDHLLNSTQR